MGRNIVLIIGVVFAIALCIAASQAAISTSEVEAANADLITNSVNENYDAIATDATEFGKTAQPNGGQTAMAGKTSGTLITKTHNVAVANEKTTQPASMEKTANIMFANMRPKAEIQTATAPTFCRII